MRDGRCVLGVDLGGTKIALAAVDPDGRIHLRSEVPSPAEDAQEMVASLTALLADGVGSSRALGLEVEAVGIGAAGFILEREGVLLESPNIAWSNVPLKSIVQRNIGLPVYLDNDANAAAAGERLAGAARGVDDFVYLTLGTGIGGGIYAGGRAYRGHRGTAAELGHMTIDPRGPVCGCGRRGCLEAMASGRALEREATRLALADEGSALHAPAVGPDGITGEMVSRAAERGDAAALASFSLIAGHLGAGIVNIIHIFDPEMVVLGGGMSSSGGLLLDRVREVVREKGIPCLVRDARVELSTLSGDAGIIGAAAMAWEGMSEV